MIGNRGAIRLSSWPMLKRINRIIVALSLIACARLAPLPANAADNDAINPPPSAQDWQALPNLPDLSRVWSPVIHDQVPQSKTNRPPLTHQVRKQSLSTHADRVP